MIASGYDNAISVSEICENEVKVIEEFVNGNLKDLIEKSGTYKADGAFKFLPGHRKLLFSLPDKVKEFQNRKEKKIPENGEPATEELELLTEIELNGLKNELFVKLNTTAKDFGLHTEFTEEELVTAIDPYISHARKTTNKATYKCSVKCTSCEKITPCTWNGRWQASNLEKHLKTHKKIDGEGDLPRNSTAHSNKTNDKKNNSSVSQKRKTSNVEKDMTAELKSVLELTEEAN